MHEIDNVPGGKLMHYVGAVELDGTWTYAEGGGGLTTRRATNNQRENG